MRPKNRKGVNGGGRRVVVDGIVSYTSTGHTCNGRGVRKEHAHKSCENMGYAITGNAVPRWLSLSLLHPYCYCWG